MASPNNKLNKVTQLTGFSDPVYAEAYVHVNQYDIVLDVLIVNQTSKMSDTIETWFYFNNNNFQAIHCKIVHWNWQRLVI